MSEIVHTQVDAVIIGGGPAGAAAAGILAEHGRDVLVLERESFPRYKVGESLIPHCWFPLERLGMIERMDAAPFTVPKLSVQFVSVKGKLSSPFYFFEHTDHDSKRTWQVVRSEFDQLLLTNAEERGARVMRETPVKELLWEDGTVVGVRAQDAQGRTQLVRARVTLDASGRDALAQARNGWRVPDKKLKKIAIWSYYEGAHRDEGIDEGATTIAYLPEKGWFWYIPLPDDKVSVGVVAESDYLYRDTRDPGEIFRREVAAQPWIAQHVEGARPAGPYRVTSDFSVRSKHCAANGLVLVGDAFGFLDPVFSSGVFLALQGGVMAADAVHAALGRNDVSAAAFAEYGEKFLQGMEAMRRLVHAFYDENFNFGAFLDKYPEKRSDMTDILVGNLYRDFSEFYRAMSEFMDLPEPLPHGRPLLTGT